MKVRIEKSVLDVAAAWAARMAPSKPSVPVLSGIRLTATSDGVMAGGSLAFEVYDYEVSGHTSVAAEVLEPGTVLVSGRRFAEIVKSLPARPVELSTDGSKVRITCGSAKFQLLTMPLDDYPALPSMPAGSGVVSGDVFAQAVAQVAVAASREPNPPMLTGVKVEVSGDRVTLMATDRYRLAVKTVQWRPASPDVSASALVRAATLAEVAKTLGAGTDITVGLDEMIGFEAAGRRTTSLLMDGEYPKVLGLFPADSNGYAVVNRAEILDATSRVGLVAERNTATRFTFDDGAVLIEGSAGEDAQGSESVDCAVVGDGVLQGFNVPYLEDGLKTIPHQYVRVTYTTSGKPVVLTGQATADGEDDPSYRYLLMPMRLPEATPAS